MTSSDNLPPSVSVGMIPGNRPEDEAMDEAMIALGDAVQTPEAALYLTKLAPIFNAIAGELGFMGWLNKTAEDTLLDWVGRHQVGDPPMPPNWASEAFLEIQSLRRIGGRLAAAIDHYVDAQYLGNDDLLTDAFRGMRRANYEWMKHRAKP